MKINTALGLLLFQLVIISCKKDDKKPLSHPANTSKDSIKTTKAEEQIDDNNFNIYSVSMMQRKELMDTFISVSDIYTDPHPVPEEIIKKQSELPFDQLQYMELDGKYRKKMLDGIHITEKDSLYLYNYEFNQLQRVPVSKLKAVAYLSPYSPENVEVDPGSYMVGFQIDTQKGMDIFDEYNHAIAYFGTKNPFVENKIKAMQWGKAGADIAKKYFSPSKLKSGNTFQARYENLTYYLQDYIGNEMITERKLAVINDRNEKIFEKTITTGGDGAEFYPLNGIDTDEVNNHQWTGYLFKGKPPVIFGFVAQSFGCPTITFLDKNQKDFTINCDNRH